MSNTSIVNGAPMTVLLGTQDKSIRAPAIEPEAIPTHLPKVYLYAAKGPTTPQLVVGNGRNQMYGDDTFDLRKAYTTHQTVLSNVVNSYGNAQMIERVVPVDAGPKANFLLSLDVLKTNIKQYKRDAEGKYLLDAAGLEIPLTDPDSPGTVLTAPGYKVKWVVTSVGGSGSATDEELFGIAPTTPGDQVEGSVQSTRYPVLQFWANSQGSYFNDCGLRIWAPTENSSGGMKKELASINKAYPFRMAAIRRLSATTTPKPVETEAGEPYFDFVLKPNQINSATDARVSLQDIYLEKYQTTMDLRFSPKYADLNGMHIYQNNIDTVLAMFHAAERAALDANNEWDKTDFSQDAVDEEYLFNLISGVSTSSVPYFTYHVDSAAVNAVHLSESTNLFARGGSDGTMSNELFAELVSSAVSEYANPNSQLMNTAVNVESIVYDTGFPLETKYQLCKFVSERKDTAVILSTYAVGGSQLSASEDHSVAVALRTKLQNYVDSDYFGTPVFRGVIIGRNGILRNSQYKGRLPLTIELAAKAARMMGASNGSWKSEFLFDKEPENVITMFDDVNIVFTPAKQRNLDWDAGLNYPMSHTRKSLYFPALKTVYDNDTSVLNSFFTMMACVELQKVGERVHRAYSGVTSLSEAQLVDAVNRKVEELTVGRFAEMFKVVPDAYISQGDAQRGFSWTLPIKLYANNMKTVQVLSIQAYRMSDLQTQ